MGCANNLAYLRRYGFQTFDQWWDESYDEIEDPIARLQAVVQIVRDISKLSNADLEKMLVDMQSVLNHNHSWFYSEEFLDLVWGELKENLTLAVDKIYTK